MCVLVYLCSTMNGYDGSLMGSINSVPSYLKYFNLPQNGAASTGIIFSIYQIGQMAGALFIWVADWRGRRLSIFIGTCGVVVGEYALNFSRYFDIDSMLGTVVTSTAKTIPTFVGGRFLLSFFSTLASTAAPLYLIEIAPPLYRGTLAGSYNTLYYMGSILATFTVYGANLHLEGNIIWRLPLWLQMICPGIVAMCIWFLPESPRWLVGMAFFQWTPPERQSTS
jgi:MFS family permease